MYRLFWLLNTFGWVVGIIFLWLVLMICAHSVLQATVETVKELIKKHEEFDKRMQTNDDKINQMIQFADRLNDENHYASDKITEKARSIDERREQLFFLFFYFFFIFYNTLFLRPLLTYFLPFTPRPSLTCFLFSYSSAVSPFSPFHSCLPSPVLPSSFLLTFTVFFLPTPRPS